MDANQMEPEVLEDVTTDDPPATVEEGMARVAVRDICRAVCRLVEMPGLLMRAERRGEDLDAAAARIAAHDLGGIEQIVADGVTRYLIPMVAREYLEPGRGADWLYREWERARRWYESGDWARTLHHSKTPELLSFYTVAWGAYDNA